MVKLREFARRRTPLGVVAIAVAVGVPLVIAANPVAGSGADSPKATVEPLPPAGNGQVDQALKVLRRPRTVNDEVPANLQEALAALRVGAAPQQGRRAFVAGDGVAVYVVPSETGACLVDSDLSETACFDAAAILGTGAAESDDCSPTLPNGDTVEIAGIVPDGASDPTVLLSNGAREPLRVTENAYLKRYVRTGPLPTRIEWNSAAGPTSVNAGVPADVSAERCATHAEVKALEADGKIPPVSGHPASEEPTRVESSAG
jgi:hypothetical protein